METISETKSNFSPSIFSPKGRIGRLSFLAWNIITLLVILVFGFIIGLISSTYHINLTGVISSILLGAIYIICIYFTYILTIKRLHDRNKSGWMSLLSLIPIINLLLFIYLICAKGDQEANGYGGPRETPLVEKILGWIYIVILPICIGAFIMIFMDTYQNYTEKAKIIQQHSSTVHQNEHTQ